jgi:hypothetical protein
MFMERNVEVEKSGECFQNVIRRFGPNISAILWATCERSSLSAGCVAGARLQAPVQSSLNIYGSRSAAEARER